MSKSFIIGAAIVLLCAGIADVWLRIAAMPKEESPMPLPASGWQQNGMTNDADY